MSCGKFKVEREQKVHRIPRGPDDYWIGYQAMYRLRFDCAVLASYQFRDRTSKATRKLLSRMKPDIRIALREGYIKSASEVFNFFEIYYPEPVAGDAP